MMRPVILMHMRAVWPFSMERRLAPHGSVAYCAGWVQRCSAYDRCPHFFRASFFGKHINELSLLAGTYLLVHWLYQFHQFITVCEILAWDEQAGDPCPVATRWFMVHLIECTKQATWLNEASWIYYEARGVRPLRLGEQFIRLYPAVNVAAAYDAEYYQVAATDARDPQTGQRANATLDADKWTTYRLTQAWADGYHRVASRTNNLPYYNYGSCEDCPRTGTPEQWRRSTTRGILDQVSRLSWGRSNRALPQIYLSPYVSEWYNVRWYLNSQYGQAMMFSGTMTQCTAERCGTAPTGRIAPYACLTSTSGTRCTGDWSFYSCEQSPCNNFPPSQGWQALSDVLRSTTTPQGTANPTLSRQFSLSAATNIRLQITQPSR